MKKRAAISILLTVALLGGTSYLSLVLAPTEATMSDVYRIFYYHVSSGWVGMLCFFVNFVASIWYVRKRSAKSDAVAAASAEVGVLFCGVLGWYGCDTNWQSRNRSLNPSTPKLR